MIALRELQTRPFDGLAFQEIAKFVISTTLVTGSGHSLTDCHSQNELNSLKKNQKRSYKGRFC